ncbi:MAG: hypothetical protein CR977_02215 [Gammaproteobacteria bacterium]|nr:MAG: hypothetical protein CR977_02215 [Gammaproteobacteria bacterium]
MTENEVYNRCLALLSRREHSQAELRYKMQQNGVDNSIIEKVLKRLDNNNYQSDTRFTEVFCRSRVGRKDGVNKIRYQLKQKGIDVALANQFLAQYADDFLQNAQDLIIRKAPRGDISKLFYNIKVKDKITRSLLNKGYDYDTIRLAFTLLKEENR